MNPSTIRKAAILISSLDEASADALLEQMGSELAERVRNALMELEEVSSGEQAKVIAEFMRAPADQSRTSSTGDDGVELDESLSRQLDREVLRSKPAAASESSSSPPLVSSQAVPFEFLRAADPALIADYLEREHPQTAAVVISHLSPEQAAGVLERMPAAFSTEALRRMAWLGQLAPEVLGDVERAIKTALGPKLQYGDARMHGMASVQAVLSALDGSRRSELLGRLADRDDRLVRQLGYGGSEDMSTYSRAPADVPSFRYRLEPAPRATSPGSHGYLPAEAGIQVEFEDLAALDDSALRRVFAVVDVQVLVLALTGAEERLTRRILRQLPTREADILRKRLSHPGPLRLSDIEQAQQMLAGIAGRLATEGQITISEARGFAAAA